MTIKSIHFPAYYLFPMVTFVLIVFTMSFRFYELNTAQFYQAIKKSDVVAYSLLQILSLASFALAHQILTWLLCSQSRLFKHSFRFANIVVNFPFLVFYGFIFAIAIF